MKPAYFGQCSCCINIDKNNYPEETELDTNPSLTLARTLTLSTGERSFGNFTPSLVTTSRFLILCIWIHQKIWGGNPESRSEIGLRWKITIAWNWRLKNKYDGNRSCRKQVFDHVRTCILSKCMALSTICCCSTILLQYTYFLFERVRKYKGSTKYLSQLKSYSRGENKNETD